MAGLGYEPIDLVAVNLYPFRETVARPDVTTPEAIENIDIGGPSMLRSAAKNHESVWVVVDPADYDRVLEGLDGAPDGGARCGASWRRRCTPTPRPTTARSPAYLSGARGAEPEDSDFRPGSSRCG
jgi:hypothetical protein